MIIFLKCDLFIIYYIKILFFIKIRYFEFFFKRLIDIYQKSIKIWSVNI